MIKYSDRGSFITVSFFEGREWSKDHDFFG